MQPAQESAKPIRAPVLLAVTCLHDAYAGQQHPDPDPFDSSPRPLPASVGEDLRRCLQAQYDRFDGLFDRAVPVDLTPADEGFATPDFGGPRLKTAILDLLPSAIAKRCCRWINCTSAARDSTERSLPIILAQACWPPRLPRFPFLGLICPW